MIAQLLLLHQDPDHLRQRRDLPVLHAHDREQFEDDQDQEDRHAHQRDGFLFDVQPVREDLHAAREESEGHERKSERQEQQGVAFLKFVRAQPADRQKQQE